MTRLAGLGFCGMGLSVQNGQPLPQIDVTGATTLYWTPCQGGGCWLIVNGQFKWFPAVQVSLSLSGMTAGKNYDVWCRSVSGVPTMDLSAAWTNDYTRAEALGRTSEGIQIKSGDSTRLWLGTIRATAATTTNDSMLSRLVWSYYNRDQRDMLVTEATDSWAGASNNAWRYVNNSSANFVEFVTGAATSLNARAQILTTTSTQGKDGSTGIGLDSTTVISGIQGQNAITYGVQSHAEFRGMGVGSSTIAGNTTFGYHKVNWLEYSNTSSGTTFYGDAGFPSEYQSGLYATLAGSTT